MSRGSRGFTLVELLIAIAIVAVLMALLVPVGGSMRRSSQVKACRATLALIDAALSAYQQDFGDFPPTSLAAAGLRTNGVNEGAEALARCLTTSHKRGPYLETSEDALGDTDADSLSGKDPTASVLAGATLYEVIDPWGHPLIYFHHRDYRGGKALESYELGEARQRCVPKPEADGRYPAPTRYLLWSAGPDGINEDGGGDDVCSWK